MAAALALVAEPAFAQDWSFLDNSPGPLARGHQDLDNPDGCKKCHVVGAGVTNEKCRDCHKAVRKSGLHRGFGQKKCVSCHSDHKGRAANISDWGAVGGRRGFEHGKTKFELTGVHQDVACTKCHLKKLRSGRTSFMGLDATCLGCHGNTHKFSSKDLLGKCIDCHGEGGRRRDLRSKDLFFDHEKRAGLALEGKHGQAKCVACHKRGKMSMRFKRTCANCHRKDSPHGRAFIRSKCNQCHSVRSFKKSSFDHDKTRFKLRGNHATKRCSKCHDAPRSKPATNCQGCHGDPHRERFVRMACKTCHGIGGRTRLGRFDHEKHGKFALTGKHKTLGCRSCHRGRGPTRFERLGEGEKCRTCHTHRNAHDGQFDDKECKSCHEEGGSKQLAFDHDKDARFALVGFHEKVECNKCHEGGNYRNDKLNCIDCHEDSHDGQLGKKCDRCHSEEVKFKEIDFDHDRLSRFELVGLHEKVECEKCHPSRNYKTNKLRCFDCHADDDPHQLKLGTDCAECHIPEKGAPKFEHDLMTSFALLGRHKETECAYCHRMKPKEPPRVGWTKTVPPGDLELTFPKMGKACNDCHFDVHAGANGSACDRCHDTVSFEASAAIHDTGAFRLMGRHDQLACVACHTENRELEGLGAQCFACHQKDDEHNNALGIECGDCHQQMEWTPARFNHTLVGYPLRGVHRAARCRDCHRVGVYAGTPTDCESCHGPSAMAVPDPRHGPEMMMMDCRSCHTEVSFAPAKPFHPWYPLVGIHQTNRCSSCHVGGVYTGIPDECIGCHEVDYIDPSNDPNHVTEGFSTDCTECHTQVTWEGAMRIEP